ncbi:hypothetical protein MASR2M15_12370 [Anaerolineales bacterium]
MSRIKFSLLFLIILFSLSSQSAFTQDYDGTMRKIYVPILMYHYVENIPEGADGVRINLTIEPEVFIDHIDYLIQEGYTFISLRELNEALTEGKALADKPIIISFDDSHLDHYTVVFPILRDRQIKGTFFVISDLADQNNPEHLNWAQIQEMADYGMEMASHTKSHHNLQERDIDFLTYEIVGSLESLSYYTNINPIGFAYPIGKYDQNVVDFLESTTIELAVTTEFGAYQSTDYRLIAPRLRVSNGTGVPGLIYLLSSSK